MAEGFYIGLLRNPTIRGILRAHSDHHTLPQRPMGETLGTIPNFHAHQSFSPHLLRAGRSVKPSPFQKAMASGKIRKATQEMVLRKRLRDSLQIALANKGLDFYIISVETADQKRIGMSLLKPLRPDIKRRIHFVADPRMPVGTLMRRKAA